MIGDKKNSPTKFVYQKEVYLFQFEGLIADKKFSEYLKQTDPIINDNFNCQPLRIAIELLQALINNGSGIIIFTAAAEDHRQSYENWLTDHTTANTEVISLLMQKALYNSLKSDESFYAEIIKSVSERHDILGCFCNSPILDRTLRQFNINVITIDILHNTPSYDVRPSHEYQESPIQ